MKKQLQIFLGALITWLVPMLVSFFLIDPETQEYQPNAFVFKVVMTLVFGLTTFLAYKVLLKKLPPFLNMYIYIPTFFLFVNTILDIVVLLLIFNMSLLEWISTIFPMYVIVLYLLSFILYKMKK